MRAAWIVLAMLTTTVSAEQAAQQKPPAPPRSAPPPIVLPLPPLNPPPAGGLTSPSVLTTPNLTTTPNDVYRNRGSAYRPRRQTPYLTGYPSILMPYDLDASTSAPPASSTRIERGWLRLSGTPATAEVFVDGLYVGTIADLESRRVLELEAGAHRVQVRAAGFDSLHVDLRIDSHETISYRATLDAQRAHPPATTAPSTSSNPIYVIPNCYIGNVPPRQNRLPAGCDAARVQVVSQKAQR